MNPPDAASPNAPPTPPGCDSAGASNAASACAPAALNVAFDLSPSAAALVDRDLRVSRANPALCALSGYAPEQISGLALASLCVWVSGQSTAAEHADAQLVRRDGSTQQVRAQLAPVAGAAPNDSAAFVLTVVANDVQQELAHARTRLSALSDHLQLAKAFVDQSNDAVVVHRLDRTIRYWSVAAEQMFGYTREQATGRTYEQLLGADATLDEQDFATLLEQGTWSGEMTCIHAAGHKLKIERHYLLVRLAGGARAVFTLNVAVGERQRADKESVLVRRLLEQRLKIQTAQLFESTQEMRDLAYSIAHDLRAPLTALLGFAAQLQNGFAQQLDDTNRHYFERMHACAHTLSEMLTGLQTLAQLAHAKINPRQVDMAALAQRIFQRLRAPEPDRAITLCVEPMPPAFVDFGLICTLLEHILGNALKFTAGTDAARIAFRAALSASGACIYTVSDNGIGFDSQYAFKLFTPFQRLHSPEEFPGIGIGLAIARKIVARHGGRIWAESAPGAGTSVSFTFHDPDVLKTTFLRPRGKIADDANVAATMRDGSTP